MIVFTVFVREILCLDFLKKYTRTWKEVQQIGVILCCPGQFLCQTSRLLLMLCRGQMSQHLQNPHTRNAKSKQRKTKRRMLVLLGEYAKNMTVKWEENNMSCQRKRTNVADFDNLSWQYKETGAPTEAWQTPQVAAHSKRKKKKRKRSRRSARDMRLHILLYFIIWYIFVFLCLYCVCQSAIGSGPGSGLDSISVSVSVPTVLGVIPKGSKLKFIHVQMSHLPDYSEPNKRRMFWHWLEEFCLLLRLPLFVLLLLLLSTHVSYPYTLAHAHTNC